MILIKKTSRVLESLNEASKSFAELKGFANSISNQHILINTITINEAKDSSEIKNILTTHDSIYKVLTESGYKGESTEEVVDSEILDKAHTTGNYTEFVKLVTKLEIEMLKKYLELL